jgi:glycine cleavage system H protein
VSEIPAELYYTEEHEWVQRTTDDTVRVGITDYAQSALGDVVFVQLPDVGAEVTAAESFGEVESTKSVSDLYAPVTGEVTETNPAVVDDPSLINSDPYGAGWLFKVAAESDGPLLSAQEYASKNGGEL